MHVMALLHSTANNTCDVTVTQHNNELNLLETNDDHLDSFSCAPAVTLIPSELSDVSDSVLDYSSLASTSVTSDAAGSDVNLLNLTQAASPQQAQEAGVTQLLLGSHSGALATTAVDNSNTNNSNHDMTSPLRHDVTNSFDVFPSPTNSLGGDVINFNYLASMTSSLAAMPTAHMMTSSAPSSFATTAQTSTPVSTHVTSSPDMMTSPSCYEESASMEGDSSGKGEVYFTNSEIHVF